MHKKTLVMAGLVTFLTGCTVAPPIVHFSPPVQSVYTPETNTEASAEIGQTIVSKAYRRVYPAISLPNGIVEGRRGTTGKGCSA